MSGPFSEPSGNKYEHGIKWGLPIVNKDWVMACLAERQIICEKPFLVGDSKVYDESRPMPSGPRKALITPSDDHSIEAEEIENLDPETTVKEDASPNTSKGKLSQYLGQLLATLDWIVYFLFVLFSTK